MTNTPSYAHEMVDAIHKFHSDMRRLNISVRISGFVMSPFTEALLKNSIKPPYHAEVINRQIIGIPYTVEDFK